MSTPEAPITPNDVAGDRLLPVRMMSEYAYCPRLFHIEHVDGLFEDNSDTVEGRSVHQRLDSREDPLPSPSADPSAPVVARSVMLSSQQLGLVAKIDLVEAEGPRATPVETKKGTAPSIPEGAYEAQRIQVCAQALLLREHGFECTHAFIYFAASHKRVQIDITHALIARTLQVTREAIEATRRTTAPPPLLDSPRCPRCSLVGVCLPDEVNYLLHATHSDGTNGILTTNDSPSDSEPTIRRLIPARDDAVPVYVQGNGLMIGKSGELLTVSEKGRTIQEVRLKDISQLSVFGNNQVSTQALQALCSAEIPVSWFSSGGWFYGVLHGIGLRNAFLRRAQFRAADDLQRCLTLARRFVAAKIKNCRTLLQRNHPEPPPGVIEELRRHVQRVDAIDTLPSLLGVEGNAAQLYFGNFQPLLKPRMAAAQAFTFQFTQRNRRPPRDPVNSMLSFGYALLSRDVSVSCFNVGLDPFMGFFHQPRHGRPALALDLMEEYRPIVVDSVVITVVNNGEAAPEDFVLSLAGCAMKPHMRRRFIEAYERRMDTLITHPIFDYRLSYRRVIELQARLLGRFLNGEIPDYTPFTTR